MINFGQFKSLSIILIVSAILLLNPSNVFKASAVPSFKYGVASGDVTSSSVVLWAQTGEDAIVKLEVTKSANFGGIPDFSSSAHATAATDFTVKIPVTGLIANTQYQYRWKTGILVSDVGSFKTAPSDTQLVDLHFSWSGDTDPSRVEPNPVPYFNDWSALQAAQLEKPSPDFFIYLGDVIYSDMRAQGKPPPKLANATILPEFRQLYKYARSVTALHDLLERTSIYPLWDDHEVRADWSGQTVNKILYGYGKQSFREYMPIQDTWAASDPVCAGPTQFRVRHWGTNADIIILDTRSCRSDSSNVVKVCNNDLAPTLPPTERASIRDKFLAVKLSGLLPPNPPPGCQNAINDPHRTMLGATQKAMFKNALLNSKAKFKFVITSVNMQQEYALPYDRWEGYAAERSEILNFIRSTPIKNVIFLSTDSHLNLMNEVFIDHFTDPRPIAYEFVTGPVAALTDEKRLSNIDFVHAKQYVLNLVGADCFNLDKLSYSSVSLPQSGLLSVALKDRSGNVIHDERLSPNPPSCAKNISPIP